VETDGAVRTVSVVTGNESLGGPPEPTFRPIRSVILVADIGIVSLLRRICTPLGSTIYLLNGHLLWSL